MDEQERGLDDLIFPRKKTLTDLWREEWEREFNRNSDRQAPYYKKKTFF